MSMTTLQQWAVLPALLVAIVGMLVLRGQENETRGRYVLLLGIGVLFLSGLAFTMRFITEPYNQPFSHLLTLLAPSLLAIMALVLLNAKAVAHMDRRSASRPCSLFWGLLLYPAFWDSRLGMSFLILPGILIVVLGWVLLGQRQLWLAIALSVFSLGALLLLNRMISNRPRLHHHCELSLAAFAFDYRFFCAGVTVVLSGVLLTAVFAAG